MSLASSVRNAGRPFSINRVILALCLSFLVSLAFWWYYPDVDGHDFFPLWYGSRLLLQGINPYSNEGYRLLAEQWHTPWAATGIAYPAPLLVAMFPFTFFPVDIATFLFLWLCIALISVFVASEKHGFSTVLLLALWFPTLRVIELKQATLLWLALMLSLWLALRWRWFILAGLCLILLPLKPQSGLVIAAVVCVWSAYKCRPVLWWGLGWGVLLYGTAWVLLPSWVTEWVNVLLHYREIVGSAWLLPLGLVVILASYYFPWYITVVIVQTIIFPINDVYSLLPIVIGWLWLGGPFAYIGILFSWVASDNTLLTTWAGILLPYVLIIGTLSLQKAIRDLRKVLSRKLKPGNVP